MNETSRETAKFNELINFIKNWEPVFIAQILDSVLYSRACDLIESPPVSKNDVKNQLFILYELRNIIHKIENT